MPSGTKRRATAHAKRAATNSLKAKGRDAVANLGPRDGPGEDYARHHDVVSRSAGIGGLRVCQRLERLWREGGISPDEHEAGRRFARDWVMGEGSAGSCLSFSVRGGGDWHPNDSQIDALTASRQAQAALIQRCPEQSDPHPVATIVAFVVRDETIWHIARQMNQHSRVVKLRIQANLKILAEHYAAVDKARGRSTTVYTPEGVERQLDPDDRRNPFTARPV